MNRPNRPSAFFAASVAVAVAVTGGATGCKKSGTTSAVAERNSPSNAASSTPPPVDRLAPGELPPGTETAFGLVLPRGLKLLAVFAGTAHAAGPLSIEDVSNYVRSRVDVRRVELGAAGTIFPAVHITGGDSQKLYRIEVSSAGGDTHVTIRDVTPKAPVPVEKLTDEEQWRRAGFNPDHTPIDPKKLR